MLSINSQLLEMARQRGIKLSEVFEISLNAVVSRNPESDLDYQTNKIREAELAEIIIKAQTELSLIRQSLSNYENGIRQQEVERLEKQKADLEAASKCKECGGLIGEGSEKFKFPIGAICHACFITGKGKLKKWELREEGVVK